MQSGDHATRVDWILDLARASIGASIILPPNAKAPEWFSAFHRTEFTQAISMSGGKKATATAASCFG